MSELGQSRHYGRRQTTSGLPLKTDIVRVGRNVAKVPEAEVAHASAFQRTNHGSGRAVAQQVPFAPRAMRRNNRRESREPCATDNSCPARSGVAQPDVDSSGRCSISLIFRTES